MNEQETVHITIFQAPFASLMDLSLYMKMHDSSRPFSETVPAEYYLAVFDGEIECPNPLPKDKERRTYTILEKVFSIFNNNLPAGYCGRSLSVGDVVPLEGLHDLCVTCGFRPVIFTTSQRSTAATEPQACTLTMAAIVLVSVWKDAGFFGLILLSGMVGIDRSYYEAASLDGAGGWKKFWRITVPLMSPAIFYVLIVALINAFQLFPQVMIMTDGGPNGATQVMVERIYRYGFRCFRMGYAAAFSWILFVIIMVCTAVQMKAQKRWVNYDA